jgi:adenine-specific DNA-methyltransferase
LVSALNEMIAVKNDLKILEDREGKSLHRYEVEVVNDELIVTDEEGELFEYNPSNKESQRIQETLFHEKQTIIENCLFGVDINTNSVKICRLRLWIELLKNAYYKAPSPSDNLSRFVGSAGGEVLETLPNIDINIKCGNSLVSRFAIDADISKALKGKKWNIDSYRLAVDSYRNAQNKEHKREMERLIAEIKTDFRTEIAKNDPKLNKLRKLQGELATLTTQTKLFDMGKKEKADWNKKVEKLTTEVNALETEIEEIKANKIFENAFEWRFEFPEVLNDDGDFVGFDVVIGNPPYIQLQAIKDFSEQIKNFSYATFEKTGDIYSLFYEKGNVILKDNGYLAYITSNKWMRAGYGKSTRNYFLTHTQPLLLVDLGSGIFEEATVDSNILIFKKQKSQLAFETIDCSKLKNINSFENLLEKKIVLNPKLDESWTIINPLEQSIKFKIENIGKPLKEWEINIFRGILTGYNDAFVIDGKVKNQIVNKDPNSANFIKPLLRGRDIKRYKVEFSDLWLINIPKGFTIKGKNEQSESTNIVMEPIPRYGFYEYDEAWEWFKLKLPAIAEHLAQFADKAKKRLDMGDYWWELRACSYLDEFEKEKIIFTKASKIQAFSIVKDSSFLLQTGYIATGKNLHYILGILNSKFIRYCFKKFFQSGGIDGEITYQAIIEIPIPNLDSKQQKPLVDIVINILANSQNNKDTTALENQIDQLVYQLYGLTEEEIKIVKGE